ncbi:KamA family protein [Tannerella forsythia KS16]|uniref:KamA family protein n=2 Tax=Tannerella forsythia TaxID=28112 RepID=G8UNL6_TANFA|nr:KamA family protein [Tannerella forsythia]AEW21256.1 KamA family protein [Tannerella forsythia 92A2]OLQ20673.1 KamA family protein [Tannerella forsythia]PDP45136.1 KamA family protein [Tannerella forsythia]SCQ21918.1 Glutamate 2,3-aminomutase [Tannerella forsythia]SCQ22839.1 Glutamate 2,3-aminomutase [Tannerella forsythia]
MKHKYCLSPHQDIRSRFEHDLPHIVALASSSRDETEFKQRLNKLLLSGNFHPDGVRNIARLIAYDGKTIFELSTESEIKLKTLSLLRQFLAGRLHDDHDVSVDFLTDLYHQFMRLHAPERSTPSPTQVLQWMKRWPSGLSKDVRTIRRENKERIIEQLIHRIERRHSTSNRYVFPEGCSDKEKRCLMSTWWDDHRFHLTFAVKNADELNRMLGHTLSEETMQTYRKAREKGIPVFVTPYYLSLLNPTGRGYDDQTLRSYVLYSPELVDTYGKIRAWEKEDVIEVGKPNAAGWLLPDGHNIHRRYPEVAILIPDSMGRACGGLCASCQRMYDFQSERLNFNFEDLKPKESWEIRLRKLMKYFEEDTQLRDILITGGDALMSQNKTLRHILDAVYKMAINKRNANLKRPNGEKYAEMQRVRLGSRLPVYLPMRINDELLTILREFKAKASAVGIKQFVIQTHFQSPLEVTPEAREALRRILSTGWSITNQLVYNVAASRRGHTAKLRKTLNALGVLCYYTFSVKGFEENYAVFAPNSRSMQEQQEEKALGKLDRKTEAEFLSLLHNSNDRGDAIRHFCEARDLPFVATDRNVLNLPGIGKSMTFTLAGITPDGKRVLEFDHDHTRRHSPMIGRIGKVFIRENKSILQYMLQLHKMGEKPEHYADIWHFTEGKTESRFPLYDYPKSDLRTTPEYSHCVL